MDSATYQTTQLWSPVSEEGRTKEAMGHERAHSVVTTYRLSCFRQDGPFGPLLLIQSVLDQSIQ